MAVVTITGAPGAPGATSAALALLLSWPLADGRRVLLLEGDPDGGAILAGALQGRVEAAAGLRNLALADRRGRLLEAMWEQCLDVSPERTGDRLLLPGLSDPAQAMALAHTWAPLAHACRSLDAFGCDVIVDLGRSGGQGPSAVMARQSDAVLAVLRTTLRGLSAARPRVAALAADLATEGGGVDVLGLLLVQEGPYSASEISRALQAPVLGLLPFAPKEARILSDGGRTADRRFQRSQLMRAARSTADELRVLIARRRVRAPGPAAPIAAGAAPVPAVPAVPASDYPAHLSPVSPVGLHQQPPSPGPAAPSGAAPLHGHRDLQPPPVAAQFAPPGGFSPADRLSPTVPATPGTGSPSAAVAGHPPYGGAPQPPTSTPLGYRPALRQEPPTWSVQDVLDLAASAQLGEGGPENSAVTPGVVPSAYPPYEVSAPPSGPTSTAGGPVTPGQAARLRAVHLESEPGTGAGANPHPEPQVQGGPSFRPADPGAAPVSDADRDWFAPLHTAPPPPLADLAPRPPAPEQFRPPEPAPVPTQTNAAAPSSGEVAHVR
ncbi:hypothetical protein ABIA32_003179 [Streptacidiphilus sp. MAP12-20]|uniref:hypothetical protein n=1 Tax=Streptacidiphilus sp. MAP12-20 TaxID=3156299 RepID=UPI00351385A9